MANKTKSKRLSKSQRIHIRRLKQAARKAGVVLPPVDRRRLVAPKDKGENNEKPSEGVDRPSEGGEAILIAGPDEAKGEL